MRVGWNMKIRCDLPTLPLSQRRRILLLLFAPMQTSHHQRGWALSSPIPKVLLRKRPARHLGLHPRSTIAILQSCCQRAPHQHTFGCVSQRVAPFAHQQRTCAPMAHQSCQCPCSGVQQRCHAPHSRCRKGMDTQTYCRRRHRQLLQLPHFSVGRISAAPQRCPFARHLLCGCLPQFVHPCLPRQCHKHNLCLRKWGLAHLVIQCSGSASTFCLPHAHLQRKIARNATLLSTLPVGEV